MKRLKQVLGIVVHCSASTWGDVAAIRQWHTEKGWSDIGYHGVILNGRREPKDPYSAALDGKIELGRAETLEGAHCKAASMNSVSLGVCMIGLPGKAAPAGAVAATAGLLTKAYATKRQWDSLVHYLAVNCRQYGLDPMGTFVHPATGRTVPVITQHSAHDPVKPFCASVNVAALRMAVAARMKAVEAALAKQP